MSKPASSAAATSSAWFVGGCAPQYPSCSPSFIGAAFLLRDTVLATILRTCSTRCCDRQPKQPGADRFPRAAPFGAAETVVRLHPFSRTDASASSSPPCASAASSVSADRTDGCIVPPAEYDPVTYEQLTEIVPVASVGTVVSWTWQPEPLEGQPLDRPFAWALIKLDGADTPLLHAVDVAVVRRDQHRRPGARALGRRAGRRDHRHRLLRARRRGRGAGRRSRRRRTRPGDHARRPRPRIEIQHTASLPESAFLRALREGKLLGAPHRRGRQGVLPGRARPIRPPARSSTHFVELPDKGTVTTFAIINIPFAGPADQAALRRGLRPARRRRHPVPAPGLGDRRRRRADGHAGRGGVEAPRGVGPGIDNIEYFRPTGEPDADYDTYKHHL